MILKKTIYIYLNWLKKANHGENSIEVEIPSYFSLLVEEVLHPFYIFQVHTSWPILSRYTLPDLYLPGTLPTLYHPGTLPTLYLPGTLPALYLPGTLPALYLPGTLSNPRWLLILIFQVHFLNLSGTLSKSSRYTSLSFRYTFLSSRYSSLIFRVHFLNFIFQVHFLNLLGMLP